MIKNLNCQHYVRDNYLHENKFLHCLYKAFYPKVHCIRYTTGNRQRAMDVASVVMEVKREIDDANMHHTLVERRLNRNTRKFNGDQ